MPRVGTKSTILQMLDSGPQNWTTLLDRTGLTDAGLFKHLKELQGAKLVSKSSRGLYEVTDEGRLALQTGRLRDAVDEEEDIETVRRTLARIALTRTYYLLFDLWYIVTRRMVKFPPRDFSTVNTKLQVIRELMLKYDPSLKRKEIVKAEKQLPKIGLTEFISGGFVWNPRIVKRGFRTRYDNALKLATSLEDGTVKSAILEALGEFVPVAARFDPSFRDEQKEKAVTSERDEVEG